MANVSTNQPLVTVAVVTYNSDYRDLRRTLHSIAIQEGIDFEVIVSDDGSESFDKPRVEEMMLELGLQDFKILANDKNTGTTINVLTAALHASGKYFKSISPGDFLYSPTTLADVVQFMESEQCRVCFGDAVYFQEGDPSSILNIAHPSCLEPYQKRNLNKIKKHYLAYGATMLGAAIVCETKLEIEYLQAIARKIVYCEDLAVSLMIANGIELRHWDHYIVWYEYGGGVSTSTNPKWRARMLEDRAQLYKLLNEAHPGDSVGSEETVDGIKAATFNNRNALFRKLGIWKKAPVDFTFIANIINPPRI